MRVAEMNPESYNLLPGAVAADKMIWRDEDAFKNVLAEIGAVILGAGYGDTLCLRLVHKHHQIAPGDVMIEYEGKHRDDNALITETMRTDQRTDDDLPSVMVVSEQGFEIAEYSRPEVYENVPEIQKILSDEQTLQKIREAILDGGFEKVLGVGFRNKKFFSKGQEEEVMIEVSDEDNGQNIVRWMNDALKIKVIQTLWSFRTSNSEPIASRFIPLHVNRSVGGCATYTFCAADVVCKKYSPGHAEETLHLTVERHESF